MTIATLILSFSSPYVFSSSAENEAAELALLEDLSKQDDPNVMFPILGLTRQKLMIGDSSFDIAYDDSMLLVLNLPKGTLIHSENDTFIDGSSNIGFSGKATQANFCGYRGLSGINLDTFSFSYTDASGQKQTIPLKEALEKFSKE